jgi:hypothetical protein
MNEADKYLNDIMMASFASELSEIMDAKEKQAGIITGGARMLGAATKAPGALAKWLGTGYKNVLNRVTAANLRGSNVMHRWTGAFHKGSGNKAASKAVGQRIAVNEAKARKLAPGTPRPKPQTPPTPAPVPGGTPPLDPTKGPGPGFPGTVKDPTKGPGPGFPGTVKDPTKGPGPGFPGKTGTPPVKGKTVPDGTKDPNAVKKWWDALDDNDKLMYGGGAALAGGVGLAGGAGVLAGAAVS